MEVADSRLKEPELDLYTIPAQSSWFSWDDIHEIERSAFEEFFTGNSITRTPKIYKEYRDFIINKYREDPSRRLTFTKIRKFLVGDVSLLHKVFLFLEKWGLINFGAPKNVDELMVENGDKHKVKIEEGVPAGVRVTATPNSLRPISAPPRLGNRKEERAEDCTKLPPLTSYSDVFGDLKKPNVLACGNCGERCDSTRYENTKISLSICEKCFKNGNYGENNSADDFKLIDSLENKGPSGATWTEEETLLLLEAVLKHGDDWELVAQNVPTKSKLDCISKLIELPFGDFLMGSALGRDNSSVPAKSTDDTTGQQLSSSHTIEQMKTEGQDHEQTNEQEQNEETVDEERPSKRKRAAASADAGSPLMKQVAVMASMVGPAVTAAAAKAAIATLCDEASCPREIYEDVDYEDPTVNGHRPLISERAHKDNEADAKEQLADNDESQVASSTDDLPLALRIRASIATALGAAAAHSKLLADQEEREMEHLVAIIIDAQLRKLQSKMKYLDHLELIMDMEHTEMEHLKQSLVEERIDVLQRAFRAGVTKRWDHMFVK